jgi:pyruvate-formate lyase-activating enzyme
MLEGVEEKLSYAAAEADWDDAAKIMALVSFISDEVRRDRIVLERFHAFLDEWVADELGENDEEEDDPDDER